MIEIIQTTPLHMIQDQGRFGLASQGIAHAGPMDILSAAWANRMAGNTVMTPIFEIAGGGFKARVTIDTNIGIAGATGDIWVNDIAVKGWGRFPVPKGSTIEIGRLTSGIFVYISVAGGLDISPTLHSVATCLRDCLGGITGQGDPLKSGDSIHCQTTQLLGIELVPRAFIPSFQQPLVCDVMVYEDRWPTEQQMIFLSQSYKISSKISRMGYRLTCTQKILGEQPRYSFPVPLGGIQILPSGEPIVLMRDHQTLGGYPLMGCVTRKKLSLLAQRRSGQLVSFRAIQHEQAVSDLDQLSRFFGHFY